MKLFTHIFLATLMIAPAAEAFEFQFNWKGLKSCTSGNPNTVKNPNFSLKDVPAGTKFIRFKLTDLNVPSYNHGGGVVAYNGQKSIAPGTFKYKSPCPPNGVHTYQWSATAQKRKNGGKIATAKSNRKYPE
ncbi:MAG: hypothetical protein P8Q99_01340 [Paracoccaceae bacterium]|nr:hypothetical protein [Paracoccaceae bacterium]